MQGAKAERAVRVAVLVTTMEVLLSTGVRVGMVTAKEQEIFGGMAMTMLDGM